MKRYNSEIRHTEDGIPYRFGEQHQEDLNGADFPISNATSNASFNVRDAYIRLTTALQASKDSEILEMFDTVASLLIGDQQITRLNYKNRIARCVSLWNVLETTNILPNSDTLRIVINCVNREMARRGRKRFD